MTPEPIAPDEITLPAVVLFAGAGGSSIGLHAAGFDPIGFEYWKPAADTHRANGMVCHDHDLSDATIDGQIPSTPLLWASPPCQPFSAAGDGEGEFDDRDGFPWTLRIIAKRLPAVVIIENVKGLTFAKHHAYFAGILASLRELGYRLDWQVLNSADYGVPQTRERCFIVCRRDGGPITWPMPTHTEQAGMLTEPWVTMADALGWDGVARYDRGEGMNERHGERPDVVFSESPSPTVHGWWRKNFHVTIDYRQTNRAGEPIYCNATDRPSPTIGTQSRSQWIVNGTQKLTAEESAVLQDFPRHYEWCGGITDVDRQIGNAVPPTMARVLAVANRPALAVTA